jgi:hypothetical protein
VDSALPGQKGYTMKTFYVSLTRDLIGVFLVFNAESERAVRNYLEQEYIDKKTGVWKLPWCSVYSKRPVCRLSGRSYIFIDAEPVSLLESDCEPYREQVQP